MLRVKRRNPPVLVAPAGFVFFVQNGQYATILLMPYAITTAAPVVAVVTISTLKEVHNTHRRIFQSPGASFRGIVSTAISLTDQINGQRQLATAFSALKGER